MPPESGAALQDWEFEALGTRWVVSTPEPLDAATRRGVDDELERIDLQWSRFRDDSVVAAMSRRVGSYPFPPTDQPLVDLYRELYEITGGAVTPFVGDTLADAGYDASYRCGPASGFGRHPRGRTCSTDTRASSRSAQRHSSMWAPRVRASRSIGWRSSSPR